MTVRGTRPPVGAGAVKQHFADPPIFSIGYFRRTASFQKQTLIQNDEFQWLYEQFPHADVADPAPPQE